jgi:hypothetical protein
VVVARGEVACAPHYTCSSRFLSPHRTLLCSPAATFSMSHPPTSGWSPNDYQNSQELSIQHYNPSESMQYDNFPDMNQLGAPGQPFSDTPNFSQNTPWSTMTLESPQEARCTRTSNFRNTVSAQAYIPQSPSPTHLSVPGSQDNIVRPYSMLHTTKLSNPRLLRCSPRIIA